MSRLLVPPHLALALVVVLAGCDAKDPASDDAGDEVEDAGDETEPTGDTSGGDPDTLVGSFQLQLSEQSGVSLVGKIYAGPTPRTLVWETSLEDGGCRLSTPRVPFCSTPCGGSAACVEDETCQAYPDPLSAGDVLVSGVATDAGATSFTMTPIADNYQVPVGTTLVDPPFAAGDEVSLVAAGDEVSGFELVATAIAPLALATDSFELDPASDLVIEWTPGAADSKVLVDLDISHHGGTKGMIECETADGGSRSRPR